MKMSNKKALERRIKSLKKYAETDWEKVDQYIEDHWKEESDLDIAEKFDLKRSQIKYRRKNHLEIKKTETGRPKFEK